MLWSGFGWFLSARGLQFLRVTGSLWWTHSFRILCKCTLRRSSQPCRTFWSHFCSCVFGVVVETSIFNPDSISWQMKWTSPLIHPDISLCFHFLCWHVKCYMMLPSPCFTTPLVSLGFFFLQTHGCFLFLLTRVYRSRRVLISVSAFKHTSLFGMRWRSWEDGDGLLVVLFSVELLPLLLSAHPAIRF